ncbi:MAG TPA: type VI secretion system protein TssA, partial [Candidatus Binataceae bacterium]|nr:type VI secretion system protein TssA [Candidatus Binataceae bacterium]
MSSPPTVEITELLTPIPGDNPSGEPLLYTATYDAIREARRSDDPNLGQGEWKHELKVANWREVKKLAIDALGTKSKDLQLAVWLAEALVKQNGFAGARDGFRLLGGLIEQFWPSLYPLSEDDDLEFRAQVVESLNKSLPPALSELKLTDSGADRDYSLNEWRESRQVEEKGRRSPEERDALIKEG